MGGLLLSDLPVCCGDPHGPPLRGLPGSGAPPFLPLDGKDVLGDPLLVLLGQLQEAAPIYELLLFFLDDPQHLAEHGGFRSVLQQPDL